MVFLIKLLEAPLKIEYKSGVNVLGPNQKSQVANLTFDHQVALETGQTEFQGFIRVHVKNSGHVEKYKDLDM